ncbi:hypothetical protein CVT25_007187 [Psilocybe cyanescens]|uniref:AB hydrolase-1 domain-containing protein n=1 Tax=Psilocybe cyanescens TaxID=93625 RepID=A0A409WVR8_PSICY|nr:hypothetical protein CVT25_007187 [Psilocybe cyanescens]
MSWNATEEGTIPFSVGGKTYATWYRASPMINSFQSFLPPVIFYDQLGNTRSTHIHDKEKAFWTIDLFIDELINVLRHFHIEDEFDLLGHSWGGILRFEFELRRKPAGLRRLVVTNSLASMPMWDQSNAQLVKSFPAWVQEGMAIGFKDLKVSAPAMKEFRTKHGCRVDPFSREYVDSLDDLFSSKGDPTVFDGLKAWDIIDKLPEVGVPILLINGRFDVLQDWVNAPIFAGLRKVKWATFEHSSHTPFWEKREKYMKLLDQFLGL